MTTLSRPGGELGREMRAGYAFVERNMNLIKRYWAWEGLSGILSGKCALDYLHWEGFGECYGRGHVG